MKTVMTTLRMITLVAGLSSGALAHATSDNPWTHETRGPEVASATVGQIGVQASAQTACGVRK
jgi:hypothetical protein